MNALDIFVLSVVFTALDDYEDDPYVHVHCIC